MGKICGDSCKAAYKIEGRIAPCRQCRKQPLTINADAFFIYGLVQNQVVTAGMGDIIGLNYNAIQFIMELYEIGYRKRNFEKVLAIFDTIREKNKE